MPLVDSEGRMIGRFRSMQHYIDCHTRLCEECGEERLPYELEDGVCVYCKQDELHNTEEDNR